MAKAAVKQEAPPAPEVVAPKGNKRKLLLIGVMVVVLLVAAAGGALFFLSKNGGGDDQEDTPAHSGKPPVFVNLDPFTVNLAKDQGVEHFLQVVAVLRVADQHISDTIKAYMPEIRHRALLLLASKNADEISSPEGREQLAAELRSQVNEILGGGKPAKKAKKNADSGGDPEGKKKKKGTDGEDRNNPVSAVLFTSFIIQ